MKMLNIFKKFYSLFSLYYLFPMQNTKYRMPVLNHGIATKPIRTREVDSFPRHSRHVVG